MQETLCDALKGRVAYFLTFYHKVRNSYGRAAIRVDGKDAVCFSWINSRYQQRDISETYQSRPDLSFKEIKALHKPDWDKNLTYCEGDFINAILNFRQMKIEDALANENYIIKALAILDKRVGKRTLKRVSDEGAYKGYPQWALRLYDLRFEAESGDSYLRK